MKNGEEKKNSSGNGLLIILIVALLILAALFVLTYKGVIPKLSTLIKSAEPEPVTVDVGETEDFSVIFEIEKLRDWDITTVYFDTIDEAKTGRADIYFATRGAVHDNNDYYVTCEDSHITATVKYNDTVKRVYDGETYDCGMIYLSISNTAFIIPGKAYECHLVRKTEPAYDHTFYVLYGSDADIENYKADPGFWEN